MARRAPFVFDFFFDFAVAYEALKPREKERDLLNEVISLHSKSPAEREREREGELHHKEAPFRSESRYLKIGWSHDAGAHVAPKLMNGLIKFVHLHTYFSTS